MGRLCRARQRVLQGRLLNCLPQANASLRGPSHGGACPRNFNVNVTCARAYVTLGKLHLDHEQDLVVTCDMWCRRSRRSRARAPAHVGRRRRRHAAVPPALLGARRPGGRGGDAALPLRPRARAARHQDQPLSQAQRAAACATSQSTCRAEREESELAQEGRDAATAWRCASREVGGERWASCVGLLVFKLVWGCAAEPVCPSCHGARPASVTVWAVAGTAG